MKRTDETEKNYEYYVGLVGEVKSPLNASSVLAGARAAASLTKWSVRQYLIATSLAVTIAVGSYPLLRDPVSVQPATDLASAKNSLQLTEPAAATDLSLASTGSESNVSSKGIEIGKTLRSSTTTNESAASGESRNTRNALSHASGSDADRNASHERDREPVEATSPAASPGSDEVKELITSVDRASLSAARYESKERRSIRYYADDESSAASLWSFGSSVEAPIAGDYMSGDRSWSGIVDFRASSSFSIIGSFGQATVGRTVGTYTSGFIDTTFEHEGIQVASKIGVTSPNTARERLLSGSLGLTWHLLAGGSVEVGPSLRLGLMGSSPFADLVVSSGVLLVSPFRLNVAAGARRFFSSDRSIQMVVQGGLSWQMW
jgi:hypothetical protein